MMPDDWQKMRQRHREYVKRLSDMLERVAPREGMTDHEYEHCIWCDGDCYEYVYGKCTRKLSSHKPECPWVEARRLLGDNLED